MKKVKIALITLTLISGLGLVLKPALAGDSDTVASDEEAHASQEETNASAESRAESTCEAGPYGQCTTTAEAEAETTTSKIVYLDDRVEGVYHEPVDAALDVKTTAAAAGTVGTGLIAFAIKIKQRFA